MSPVKSNNTELPPTSPYRDSQIKKAPKPYHPLLNQISDVVNFTNPLSTKSEYSQNLPSKSGKSILDMQYFNAMQNDVNALLEYNASMMI